MGHTRHAQNPPPDTANVSHRCCLPANSFSWKELYASAVHSCSSCFTATSRKQQVAHDNATAWCKQSRRSTRHVRHNIVRQHDLCQQDSGPTVFAVVCQKYLRHGYIKLMHVRGDRHSSAAPVLMRRQCHSEPCRLWHIHSAVASSRCVFILLHLKRGDIEFWDVSFSYKPDRSILQRVSFCVCPCCWPPAAVCMFVCLFAR